MRYVFIGAGAVGSAIGGLLVHAGTADVLLVSRGDHAHAMRTDGLTVRCPDTCFTVPVDVITSPERVVLHVDDVLVLTTKTHHAAVALADWADVAVRDEQGKTIGCASDLLPILIASNGVASERMALRYFTRVFAVCVWFPAVRIEPGEVIVRGTVLRGVFHIGRYPSSPADVTADAELLDGVAADWTAAGCLVERPDAVMAWKYRKLLANLGNVLQALLGDDSDAVDIRHAAEGEGRTALHAANIAVVSDEQSQHGWHPPGLSFAAVPGEPAQLGGSSWQSLVRGTGTIETDYLNGEIVYVARQHGQPALVNSRLTGLARHAARERLQPGTLSAGELRGMLLGELAMDLR